MPRSATADSDTRTDPEPALTQPELVAPAEAVSTNEFMAHAAQCSLKLDFREVRGQRVAVATPIDRKALCATKPLDECYALLLGRGFTELAGRVPAVLDMRGITRIDLEFAAHLLILARKLKEKGSNLRICLTKDSQPDIKLGELNFRNNVFSCHYSVDEACTAAAEAATKV